MQSKNVYVLEDSYSDDFTPQKSRWWKKSEILLQSHTYWEMKCVSLFCKRRSHHNIFDFDVMYMKDETNIYSKKCANQK